MVISIWLLVGFHPATRSVQSTPRVRATDRHCRQMRRNNIFGAKNCSLATTIGERQIASENFCLASERHLLIKPLPRAALF